MRTAIVTRCSRSRSRTKAALDHYLTHGTESYAEALSYFPDLDHYNLEPDSYLEHVQQVKRAADIPVIGSLNGISPVSSASVYWIVAFSRDTPSRTRAIRWNHVTAASGSPP